MIDHDVKVAVQLISVQCRAMHTAAVQCSTV